MRIIGTLDARTGRITPTIVPTFTTASKDSDMSKLMHFTTDAVATAVLDAARAVARLDSAAMMPRVEVCFIDGQQWTLQEVIDAVASHLLRRMRASMTGAATYGVPLATVQAMLGALGADQATINMHAPAVAKSMRRDWRNGS